jgi:hypothetical protein
MEVDLPDGGRVIVAFADIETRASEGAVAIATTMIVGSDHEGEMEEAIVEEAASYGLTAAVSRSRHPTTILIRTEPATAPTSE